MSKCPWPRELKVELLYASISLAIGCCRYSPNTKMPCKAFSSQFLRAERHSGSRPVLQRARRSYKTIYTDKVFSNGTWYVYLVYTYAHICAWALLRLCPFLWNSFAYAIYSCTGSPVIHTSAHSLTPLIVADLLLSGSRLHLVLFWGSLGSFWTPNL